MAPLNNEDPTDCINKATTDLLLLKVHTQEETLIDRYVRP